MPRIIFSVTEEERAIFIETAKDERMTLSAWIRDQLRTAASNPPEAADRSGAPLTGEHLGAPEQARAGADLEGSSADSGVHLTAVDDPRPGVTDGQA